MAADPRDRYFDTSELEESVEVSAARGGRLVAMAQAARGFIEIGATMVLVRLLAPRDFGLVAMVTAVTGFVALFKDLGLSTVTVQRKTITHQEVSALLWINVAISTLLVGVVAALAPALAWFYKDPRLVHICLAVSTTFFLGGLTNQHVAVLRRRMRFGALAAVDISSLSVGIVVGVAAALTDHGYWALVYRNIAQVVVTLVGAWIACPWRPSRPQRVGGLRKTLTFGANLTGFSLINYLIRNLDDLLIGRFGGPTPAACASSLGQYQKAYELLMTPLHQLNAPVSTVAIPALSRLQDQPDRYRNTYLRILKLVIMATMPLAAYLIVTAEELVLVVFGDQWREAGVIFGVLGIAAITQPIGNSVGWLFISQDRTHHMLRWGVFGGVVTIASFVVGLPWGAMGVAAGYALSGLVIRTPALLWYIGRSGPVRSRDIYLASLPFLAGGAATAGTLLGLRQVLPIATPILVVLTHAVAGAVAAFLVMALFPSSRSTIGDAIALATKRLALEAAKPSDPKGDPGEPKGDPE